MKSKMYNRAMRGAGQKFPSRTILGNMKSNSVNSRTYSGKAKGASKAK